MAVEDSGSLRLRVFRWVYKRAGDAKKTCEVGKSRWKSYHRQNTNCSLPRQLRTFVLDVALDVLVAESAQPPTVVVLELRGRLALLDPRDPPQLVPNGHAFVGGHARGEAAIEPYPFHDREHLQREKVLPKVVPALEQRTVPAGARVGVDERDADGEPARPAGGEATATGR